MKLVVLITFVVWGVIALVAFLYKSTRDKDE